MKKNSYILLTVLSVVIVVLIIAVVYFVKRANDKEKEIAEVVEMMSFEKEQVEREFQDLTTEFDGYSTNIKNDSLFKLLDNQKIKVQQLLEELRITKATNAKRIAELRKELATVRKVMVHYVNQIDSLDAANKILKTENVEVNKKYKEASQTVEQLSKEKQNLNEVVTRASKLDMSSFSMTPLNKRNKKVSWLSDIATLQFNYTIAKNITSEPGQKTLYLRITRPDEEVLTKTSDQVFQFENKYIQYSAKKDFEYTGEQLSGVIFWKVEEILQNGKYRADFFVDGNLIGKYTFEIKK